MSYRIIFLLSLFVLNQADAQKQSHKEGMADYYRFSYAKASNMFKQASLEYEQEGNKTMQLRVEAYLAICQIYNQEYSSAIELLNGNFTLALDEFGDTSIEISDYFSGFGKYYEILEVYDTALMFYDAALAVKKNYRDSGDLDLMDPYINMGIAHDYSGQYDSAIHYYQKGLEISMQNFGPGHPYSAYLFNDLGVVYKLMNDYPNSLKMALKAVESRQSVYGENSEEVSQSFHNVAVAYDDLHSYEKAIAYYKKSLELKKKLYLEESEQVASAYESLGNAYSRANSYDKAIEFNTLSYNLREKSLGKEAPETLDNLRNLGNVHFDAGRFSYSIELYEKYLKRTKNMSSSAHNRRAEVTLSLGESYENLSDYRKAMGYFEKSILIEGSKLIHSKGLLAMARIYDAQSQYGLALSTLEGLRRDLEQDDPLLGYLLNNLAFVYMNLSEYDKAYTSLEESLKIRQSAYGAESPEVAQTFSAFGRYYFDQEKFQESLDWYQKALEIKKTTYGQKHPQVLSAMLNVSAAYGHLGDFRKEVDLLNDIEDNYNKVYGESYIGHAKLRMNSALAADRLGNVEQALKDATASLKMTKDFYGENSENAADVQVVLATLLVSSGHASEGLTLNLQALKVYEQLFQGPHLKTSDLLNNMGVAFLEQHEGQKAKDYFQQALIGYNSVFGKSNAHVVAVKNNLAMAELVQDKYPEAIRLFKENILRAKELGLSQQPSRGIAHQNLGLCYLLYGEEQLSYEEYLKSLKIKIDVLGPLHYEVADLMINVSNYHLKKASYDSALNYLVAAEKIYKATFGNTGPRLARCYNNLSSLMIKKGALTDAEKYIDMAIVANTKATGAVITPVQKLVSLVNRTDVNFLQYLASNNIDYLKKGQESAFLADKLLSISELSIFSEEDKINFSVYKSLLTNVGVKNATHLYMATMDKKYVAEAFYFAERSKSSILLTAMKATNVKNFRSVDKSLVNQEKDLEVAMQKINLEIHNLGNANFEDPDQRLEGFQEKLFVLKRQYEENQNIQKQKYRKYFNLKHDQSTATIKELRTLLISSPNVALIEYALSDSLLHAIVIHQKGSTIISTPVGEPFEKKLNAFRKAVMFKADNVLGLITQEIYDVVMREVESYFIDKGLGIEQLIIVPEGPLNYLPFEALARDSEQGSRYLIQDYAISYSYSFSLIDFIEKRETKDVGNSWLAFAPVFSKSSGTENMTQTSQDLYTFTARSMTDKTRAFTLNGQYIEPLPGTEKEVRKIDEMAKASGAVSKYFTYKDADESVLKSDIMKDYKFIHFATHGFINEGNPAYSGILMSQNPDSDEDCVLHASEIYNLELNAELVTLSACETGLGKMAFGEGIVGLSRSFLYAGASNLLVSQWKVNDESTSRLMIDFYSNLLKGKDKAASLRTAKLALLETPEFKNPYYWAPFVLIGK